MWLIRFLFACCSILRPDQSECVHECVSEREVICIVGCIVCELRNLTRFPATYA